MTPQHLLVAKTIICWTARLGAGKVTHSIIANHVVPQTAIQKILTVVGGTAIGGIVADAAMDKAGQQFDETVVTFNQFKDFIEKRQTEKK